MQLKRGGWPYSHPPNVPVELNTSHPIAKGIVSAWLPQRNNVIRDLGPHGFHLAVSNSNDWRTTARFGVGQNYLAASDVAIGSAASGVYYANQVDTETSIVSWVKTGSSIYDYGPVVTTYSTLTSGFGFYTLNDAGDSGVNTFGFSYSTTAGGFRYEECAAPANSLSTNTVHLLGMSFQYGSPTTMRLFLNGAYKTPTWFQNTGEYPIYTDGGPIWMGNDYWASEYLAGQAGPVIIWNRRLTDAEHWYLYNNFWELFRPKIPMWGAWAGTEEVTTWVSPTNHAEIGTLPTLVLTTAAFTGNLHIHLQLDTASSFDTGNLRELKTNVSVTGWQYWDGDSWETFPSTGLPDTYSGNDVRYTVQSALSEGTWYRRVRQG